MKVDASRSTQAATAQRRLWQAAGGRGRWGFRWELPCLLQDTLAHGLELARGGE